MPLTIPTLDDRRYQDLLDEALARIPIHNPEWTNFNQSDPGVTLLQVFSFLTENLLYRSNQIPERNRRKFLSLLGVPLQAASSARGLVTFNNERGALQTLTLNSNLEVRAGQVPYRTTAALDVLPIEAQVFYKRELTDVPQQVRDYYAQLYASFRGTPPSNPSQLRMYDTRPLVTRSTGGLDVGKDTMDSSLWIALLVRASDKPYDQTIDDAREAIGGKTLNLGLVPYFDVPQRTLTPGTPPAETQNLLNYQLPAIPESGGLSTTPSERVPAYQTLATSEVPIDPVVIQITLPPAEQLTLWNNFDPLESGVGDFPPNLEDTTLNDRVITWLRIVAPKSANFKVMWAGLNAVFVDQRARVANELLPAASGEPDQSFTLSRTPVIPGTVQLSVTLPTGAEEQWAEIDDLLAAGPEVPAPDLRQSPSVAPFINTTINVFTLDAEAGVLRFGDGTHGRRPPRGAVLRASYDYGLGREGNVGPSAINNGPALPAGIKVSNPVRAWRGAEAETVSDGEKQIARYLQHRDRLVNAADFDTITRRTPGIDIGRVEVLPAYNPKLTQSQIGDAPGAVTLLLVPKYDALHPDTPEPDQIFINAVCEYLDPRRLVTTEVFLRGPTYKPIWISVGFKAVAGASVASVREAIKSALYNFLSPLPNDGSADPARGWPLLKPVIDRELLAVASRVKDVLLISDVFVASGTDLPSDEIEMTSLELPRIAGLAISVGEPIPIDQLRGQPSTSTTSTTSDGDVFKPVPVVPEECT
jgi:hypothetical protein